MTTGYAESPLILRLFGTISCFFLAKMVTTTVADTATSPSMHTEFSTATQQEYRANGDKIQRNSENAREDPAQCTRMGASSIRQKNIAVIGTTGFLGPYLLASLLQTHTGSNILCINRSADAEQRTLVALKGILGHCSTRHSRARFLVADITRQDVGMGPVQDALLASAVEEVIFNAWNPHWGLPLENFQPLLKALASTIDP